MRTITPYLAFDGKCREVMQFYESCFCGKLDLMTYAGTPAEKHANEHEKDFILHSSLTVDGKVVLMASDCTHETPQSSTKFDGNVALCIDCHTEEELRQQFSLLSEGGSVTMALEKQWWNAIFGMLTDKYGVHWMLSYDLKSDNKSVGTSDKTD